MDRRLNKERRWLSSCYFWTPTAVRRKNMCIAGTRQPPAGTPHTSRSFAFECNKGRPLAITNFQPIHGKSFIYSHTDLVRGFVIVRHISIPGVPKKHPGTFSPSALIAEFPRRAIPWLTRLSCCCRQNGGQGRQPPYGSLPRTES